MKKLIYTLSLCCLYQVGIAQTINPPVDSLTHKIAYSDVIKTDGARDQLFDKGLNFLALAFKSSNDVIQIKDKDNGKIVGKWMILPAENKLGYVSASITLLFKDGRYKYIISDLYYEGNGGSGLDQMKPWALEEDPGAWKVNMTKGAQHRIKNGTYSQIDDLISGLKKYMAANNKQNDF